MNKPDELNPANLCLWIGRLSRSREQVGLRVRIWGTDGSESPWSELS